MKQTWWKEGVIYQIYPRSFNDSNGDGIGDIPGIIEKADYFAELGVDAIWLSPIYGSPNDDNGYDISDYFSIMPEFGTLEDVDELISVMHEKGIRVIMDLVVNHTSDEHQWFIESRSSKDNPYRDYYIWRPGKDGKEPNNWESFFSGSAWEYDEASDEYFMHIFSRKQPDLNWENSELRSKIADMINWWIDRGVDGFRVDAINIIGKPEGLPDAESTKGDAEYVNPVKLVFNQPSTHRYINELNQATWGKAGILSIGECANTDIDEIIQYSAVENDEFSMVIPFDHVSLDVDGDDGMFAKRPFELLNFKTIVSNWQKNLHNKGHIALYLSNHDWPRAVSRIGNDNEYRVQCSKLFFMLLATLEGTPFIYQGEEFGMIDSRYDGIHQYRDVASLNKFKELKKKGNSEEAIVALLKDTSRDNSRSPMQWSADANAGFSIARPWIDVPDNYMRINAEADRKSSDSIFEFYRKMISYRKSHPDLVHGSYQLLEPSHRELFAYKRNGSGCYKVLLNFSSDTLELPESCKVDAPFELCTWMDKGAEDILRPWEGRIYKLA